jgi:hypothetical protein
MWSSDRIFVKLRFPCPDLTNSISQSSLTFEDCIANNIPCNVLSATLQQNRNAEDCGRRSPEMLGRFHFQDIAQHPKYSATKPPIHHTPPLNTPQRHQPGSTPMSINQICMRCDEYSSLALVLRTGSVPQIRCLPFLPQQFP